MNNSTENKIITTIISEAENTANSQNKNLQESRASVLERHLHQHKNETQALKNTSQKEIEIKKLKEEINKIKGEEEHPFVQNEREEYAHLVNKILFDFRNEINSPINSIEYSTENLKVEYDKLIKNFALLSESAYPTESLGRAFDYVNAMLAQPPQETEDVALTRERKKKFSTLLDEYTALNSNRAAEYFVTAGIFYVDAELFWILSQPKGEVLFEIMISLLSINQSFDVLNSAKSRTRFLTSNLIIPSEKEIHNLAQEDISAEEKRGDKILKRKFISDQVIPIVKMVIILLNLFAIFKMIFRF